MIDKYKLHALREIAIFMIITLTIHYSYRFWANELRFEPIPEVINSTRSAFSDLVYAETVFITDKIFGTEFTTERENRVMYFDDNAYMGVNESCSGFKQILQFFLLFLIYPGPWRKKLWYIPLGIVIVHFTNLFRIVGLAVIIDNWPEHWLFAHDYVYRIIFYAVIFMLWVIWVEKIYPDRMKEAIREA